MYNRFENGIHPRDQVSDILAAARDHSSSLEDHIRLLEKVSVYKHLLEVTPCTILNSLARFFFACICTQRLDK